MGYFLKKEVEKHVQKIMEKYKKDEGLTIDHMIEGNNFQEINSVNFAYKNGELI
jgi:hypothetical protein